MAKVSVIVPVYNVEKYLKQCLDSIVDQTLEDLEIVLVDDGSVDSSGTICDEYAKKDTRIRVIHKENGGLSDARNAGLKYVTSPYVGFIDSDDYVQSEYLEELMKYRDCDLVQCSTLAEPTGSSYLFDDSYFVGKHGIRQCLSKYIYPELTVPFGRLYRSAIQRENRLFFDTCLYSGEDTLWVSQYLLYVRSVRTSSYAGYVYVHHMGEHLSLIHI